MLRPSPTAPPTKATVMAADAGARKEDPHVTSIAIPAYFELPVVDEPMAVTSVVRRWGPPIWQASHASERAGKTELPKNILTIAQLRTEHV
jgi:hypothetical protein